MLFHTLESKHSMLAGAPPAEELKLRVWAVIAWFAFIIILFVIALIANYTDYQGGASAALHLAEVIGGAGIGAIFGERTVQKRKS